MAMTLVSTVTVGSGGAASIEFTGIAGTGKDLLFLFSGRDNSGGATNDLLLTVNGATTGYADRNLAGNGSTALSLSSNSAGVRAWQGGNGGASTSNTFSNYQAYISNYASSVAKSISVDSVEENNSSTAVQQIVAGSYSGTSAITSIKIQSSGANLVQYSTASLYIIS